MSTDKAKLFDRLGSSQSNQISQAKHESCLLDLPTFNHKNFSLYDRSKILNKRPVHYIAVKKECDSLPQVIVADNRNLLVKYYSKRWHYVKRQGAQASSTTSSKKRDVSDVENSEEPGPSNKQLRTI